MKYKILLLSILLLSNVTFGYTEEVLPLKIEAEKVSANLDLSIKDNFVKSKYASAVNKFTQGNVKAAYDDFNAIIQKAEHDDYMFLIYADKMSECGFFDLVDQLISRIDENIYTSSYVKDLKKFYYPSSLVKNRDYVGLADAYSNIIHNNMAIETTSDLLSNSRIDESDYKNYLIALGYYKSNNINKALKYINNAIVENNKNVNYKILKIKILADLNKNNQALKMLEDLKKENFETIDFKNKIQIAEEYILYKTSKNDVLKDYHLSYYYHLQGKSLLATKVLQASIIQAKQYSPEVFSLLSKIYYDNNENLKANEFAQRAFKEDKNNSLANLILADIHYENRDYDSAIKYYKKVNTPEYSLNSKIGIAKSLLALNQDKKAKKMFINLLKKSDDKDLLIESLRILPERSDEYLPKAISQDLKNADVWIALAHQAITDNNYKLALICLNNSYYIDSNNFKYYYYLSLVFKARGDLDMAEQYLIKCSRLNSDYNAELKIK